MLDCDWSSDVCSSDLEEDIKYLEHWLTAHIFGADMKLGAYLVAAM
jgi:hypothetical protein